VNPIIGWGLAAAGMAAGWIGWGWRGLVLGLSVVVFWLLLQFSRSLRVLRNAGSAPIGHVDSAVMLHSRLQHGMSLMQVLHLTRSLGRKLGDEPETWAWSDAGGAAVELVLQRGRLVSWRLTRDAPPRPDDGADAGATT
jgi:hypothetical protein